MVLFIMLLKESRKNMEYRVYGASSRKGYELIAITYEENDVFDIIDNLNRDDYIKVLVIRHNYERKYDEPYIFKILEKEMVRERK